MIDMALVLRGATVIIEMVDTVPGKRLRWKAGRKAALLGADIEAVETILEGEDVVVRQDDRLEALMTWCHGARRHRFDDDHSGTKAGKIGACQHVGLGALDVDFKKIDHGDVVVLAQLCQRRHRLMACLDVCTKLGGSGGMRADRR